MTYIIINILVNQKYLLSMNHVYHVILIILYKKNLEALNIVGYRIEY